MGELYIPSFGSGYSAYEAAKRWISTNFPNLTPEQYAVACAVAARSTGV